MNQELMEAAILGRDAEEFWKTPLGINILRRMSDERKELVIKLETTNPRAFKRIGQIQSDIKRIDTMKSWFSELIILGRQAEKVIDEQET